MTKSSPAWIKPPRLWEVIVIILILGAITFIDLAGAFLLPIIASRHPQGNGSAIPTQPPNEANRVSHPSGLSIVLPEGWEVRRASPPEFPELTISPRTGGARRLPAVLTILSHDVIPPSNWSAFHRIDFLGSVAYERCVVEREDTFDDPASSRYELYVHQEDRWHHVNYLIAAKHAALPEMVREYIETIRWPATLATGPKFSKTSPVESDPTTKSDRKD